MKEINRDMTGKLQGRWPSSRGEWVVLKDYPEISINLKDQMVLMPLSVFLDKTPEDEINCGSIKEVETK